MANTDVKPAQEPESPAAPMEPATTEAGTTAPEFEIVAGPSIDQVSSKRGINWDRANKSLSIVTAQGYNGKGQSVGTVIINHDFDDEASAKEGAKVFRKELAAVAPKDKRVAMAFQPNAEGKVRAVLFLKNPPAARAKKAA